MPDAQFIAAAAAPICDALAAIGDLRIMVPSSDVLISYCHSGCTVRLADHRAAHRDAVESALRQAFTAAGWGVSPCSTGGLSMKHPSRL
ncbi:hypothetical protein [Streptomyces sp. NRRL F-5135]|uniref:hypothetical protein n=1 Tax=Streptomyces sp. NRRL F-5135 TaxID=1463858 RepID=UPI0004C8505F|nr:hypothetical protein [Streptomyces sp. NRRL F-5135]